MRQGFILVSGLKGSGKTTLAEQIALIDSGAIRESFARPIKHFVEGLLACGGGVLSTPAVKEGPSGLQGFTFRRLMQTVGDVFRQHVSRDFWAEALYIRVQKTAASWVVVDDWRFPNERKVLERYGPVFTVCVCRASAREAIEAEREAGQLEALDPSEAYAERFAEEADYVITNDGGLEQLKCHAYPVVLQAMNKWKEEQ